MYDTSDSVEYNKTCSRLISRFLLCIPRQFYLFSFPFLVDEFSKTSDIETNHATTGITHFK